MNDSDVTSGAKVIARSVTGAVTAIVVVIALILLWQSFRVIPVASVGIKFNAFTGASQRLMKPELVFVNPFTDRLIVYPTSIVNATFVRRGDEGDRAGDDSIRATTSEGAILPIDVTIAYRMPGDRVSVQQVWDNFGLPSDDINNPLREIQRTHIRWATVVAINRISGGKSIFDLISRERATYGDEVQQVLAPMMREWGFIVEDVMIREVYPPDEITERIQQQQANRSDLDRSRIELQQATIDAETTRTNAQRIAEQNRLLAGQGEKTLALKLIEKKRKLIEKWNGKSPLVGLSPLPF